jgi:phosphoenolpyruvate carboxylase
MPNLNSVQPSGGLKSTRGIEVAIALSDQWLESIKKEAGGVDQARRLKLIRDTAWNLDGTGRERSEPLSAGARAERFNEATSNLMPIGRKELLESYARLGHIYEIAGLVARENFFELCRAQGTPIPGGVNEFLKEQEGKTQDEVLQKIGQPVFEVVMTQHPTNVNSLDFQRAQRALAIEVEKSNKGKEADVVGALANFQHTPITKTEAGEPVNLQVRDELNNIINTFENLYNDVPRVFAQYDRQLQVMFPDEYRPQDLKLNMHLASWGSAGDKDGNSKITAFHTLEGIALHSKAILQCYSRDLEGQSGLEEWKQKIDANLKVVSTLQENITELRKRQEKFMKESFVPELDSKKLDEEFDALSKQLAAARKSLNKGEFEQAIKQSYEASHDEKQLELLRRVRTFGFTFGKIEYRETAEEYARVVGHLLAKQEGIDYDSMSPEQRVELLTQTLMRDGGHANLGNVFQKAVSEVLRKGAGHKYSDTDVTPIGYQTLKRMQLARDHDDMITDNVLAECGKMENKGASDATVAAKGASNLLEAQLLQRLVQDPADRFLEKGKAATMGIVPLFEEPETMKNIDAIMKMAYDNSAYKQHMQAVAEKFHDGNITQQVQIAHSDNARRSGLQAARGLIHQAHRKMRELNDKEGITTQFFEGGSMSDAYRNGLRCPSAVVDAFGLHDFAKFTFQGGDLLNYFNLPFASERLFSRNLAGQSRGLARIERGEDARTNGINQVMDEVAITALKATLKDYEDNDFTRDKMGLLLEALDYKAETEAGNSTSRAPGRSTPAFAAGSASVQLGAVHPVEKKELTGIPIDKVRTIAYSESSQHAGLVLSWVGSDHLLNHIGEAIVAKKDELAAKPQGAWSHDEQQFMTAFSGVKKIEGELSEDKAHYTLSAEHIHTLYEESPAFHDAQDRSAFAVAMTNMDRVRTSVEKNLEGFSGDEAKGRLHEYMDRLEKVFKRSSWVAAVAVEKPEKSNQYESVGSYNDAEKMTNKHASDMVRERLEIMKEEMGHKRGYRSFGIHVKANSAGLSPLERRHIHNAVDTVVHGRWSVGDIKNAYAMKEYHEGLTSEQSPAIS